MRVCTKCKQEKDELNFSLVNGKPKHWCKKCVVQNSLKWAAANRDKVNERSRKWNAANPEKRKISALKLYGLTLEQYEKLLIDQKSQCRICGAHKEDCARGLAVDHDHSTGVVRGLLCGNCNRGLGYFKDSPGLLLAAIEYLADKVI